MYRVGRSTDLRHGSRVGGFTIVELLIVIVIIGILAGLVISIFRGIQDKANNARTIDAVVHWEKSIRAFQVTNEKLPEDWTCLGNSVNDFPAGGPTSWGLGVCEKALIVNSGWSSEFKTVPILGQTEPTADRLRANTNAPNGALTVLSDGGGSIRGIIYASIAGPSEAPNGLPGAFILYALKNQDCGSTETYKTVGTLSICAKRLTTPSSDWIYEVDVYVP